jgi:hypothetical protein
MTPDHPAWPEFLALVDEGLEPKLDDSGNVASWTYSGYYRFALAACRELGLSGDEILDSIDWWKAHGAFNDDEIAINLS